MSLLRVARWEEEEEEGATAPRVRDEDEMGKKRNAACGTAGRERGHGAWPGPRGGRVQNGAGLTSVDEVEAASGVDNRPSCLC